jgi:hypothetical protein
MTPDGPGGTPPAASGIDPAIPKFDERPSIRITNTILENRKIVGLSDKAFRAYIAAICYCSRQETDGLIVKAALPLIAPPKVIAELVEAGLLERDGRGYAVHDYLKHQRRAVEIRSYREARSADGKRGNHLRWHVPRREHRADCEFCLQGAASV